MKKQLFLYLFILSALLNVFTYMYYSKKDAVIEKRFEEKSKNIRDSITLLSDKLYDSNYFSLETNDRAQDYLEVYNIEELMPKVQEALLSYNDDKIGNKYVDQPLIEGKKFIVNKIKILNHRWIIADYSNSEYWGEALIQYFIEDDKSISFKTIQTYLYPKQIIQQ